MIGILSLIPIADPTTNLNAIFDRPEFAGAIVAARVETPEGKVLFERNPHLRVVPASNQKLITGAFALSRLAPDYRPETRFWRTETGLTIDSPGDPSLTFLSLSSAASQLKLPNGLPVRVSQAYAPGIPVGWELDDLPNRYAARVSAFTVDRGGFELWAEDGRLKLLPRNYGVSIRQVAGPGTLFYDPFKRILIYPGAVPAGKKLIDTLALPYPTADAASIFGEFDGEVAAPPARAADLIIRGRPLSEILARCLQPSDNQLAEQLMLMAMKKRTNYTEAQGACEKFLTETVQIPKSEVRVLDGSGMSRHNLTTASALTQLLRWQMTQPTADVYRNSLASPGLGTLAGRLDGIAFSGKTGSLDAVAALSGYLQTEDGREVVVSFVSNHHVCPNATVRQLFDEAIKAARGFR